MGITLVIKNFPSVSVPVLSNTIVDKLFSASKWLLAFISIPFLDATPMPLKKLNGIDITSAQGQDITKKIKAL